MCKNILYLVIFFYIFCIIWCVTLMVFCLFVYDNIFTTYIIMVFISTSQFW